MPKPFKNYDVGMIRVNGPDDLPEGKHYVIMVYDKQTRSEYTPSYHPRDKEGSYYTVNYMDTQHWVTTNEEVWKSKILEMEKGESRCGKNAKYTAFIVDKIAKVKLNVSVALDVR